MILDHEGVSYRGIGNLGKDECVDWFKETRKALLIGIADIIGWFLCVYSLSSNFNELTLSGSYALGFVEGVLLICTLAIFMKFMCYRDRLKEIEEGEDDEFESQ